MAKGKGSLGLPSEWVVTGKRRGPRCGSLVHCMSLQCFTSWSESCGSRPSSGRQLRSSLTLFGIVGLLLTFLGSPILLAAPSIIPLPKQLTNRPGVFTLCSGQPVPGVAAQPLVRILADPSSIDNAQYLATMLFRSTGFQFSVTTNSTAGPVRNSILLTTNTAVANLERRATN